MREVEFYLKVFVYAFPQRKQNEKVENKRYGNEKVSAERDEKAKTRNETKTVDKKSHFRSLGSFCFNAFFLLSTLSWITSKVTNHGHQCNDTLNQRGEKHQTRTNINCHESIFQTKFLFVINGQENIITL